MRAVKSPLAGVLRLFGLPTLLGAFVLSGYGQSNIVVNGGFEGGGTGWQVFNGQVLSTILFPFEGSNRLSLSPGGAAWQDLNTIPGRDYVIVVASTGYNPPIVKWQSNTLTLVNGPLLGDMWRYRTGTAVAQESITRLSIETRTNLYGGASFDDIRVGWVQEPISVLTHPVSSTGFEGGAASFAMVSQGGPPLSFQWFFNGSAIANETNGVLTLNNLRLTQAGTYSVSVSNVAGTVWANPAELTVEPSATSPVLLVQPESQIVPSGYGYTLNAFAVGRSPLSYQWLWNGQPITGATNRILSFASLAATNSGVYVVLVSNALGSTLSLPATLSVTSSVAGGWMLVTNTTPLRDIDGTTRLSGSHYMAQTYVGSSPDLLRPIKQAIPLRTNTMAGFFLAPLFAIPNVPAGSTAYGQIRAWDAFSGQSYEEARACGGKFGASEIRQYTASNSPVLMHLMLGFSLRPGLPFFNTGRLSHGPTLPGGTRQLVLTGEPGFRYLIEEQIPPNTWQPLFVVTNTSGTVTFPIPDTAPSATRLYRSRILD